ncbi:cysteine desulfurase family protein [Adlercreutzia sp. ZJ304]|uniref:cysteine desulfurase family protein n=1 Tax=Adlercreutzia sp. ZJ304 TaxID=2709791 RepID=UPI0013ED7940|nr:cysteine desulfurase family protein [Adlercreutzia sp. ZJ304]
MSDTADFIYLDYAATSPLCEEALSAMQPYLRSGMGGMPLNANANTLYTAGRVAYRALEDARRQIAKDLGARPDEIIFTSGATEADNAALIGIAHAEAERRNHAQAGVFSGHIIVSVIEHDAVLQAADKLSKLGFQVEYLKPTRNGFIDAHALQRTIRENTILVSVQVANSEVGAIQPVRELAAIAHSVGAFFHTDATQALGKQMINLHEWGVDAASFSAHKIGAMKGVGALYLKARTPFAPQALGGGQENKRRSGTQNVCGATAFAAACKAAISMQAAESARLMHLRDKIYSAIASMDTVIPTVQIKPASLDYLPNIVNMIIPGIESETLVLRFDSLGIAVSGGSACSSQSLEPSHVLRAMGISSDDARCALRVSMGRTTTENDVEAFLQALPKVIHWMRS